MDREKESTLKKLLKAKNSISSISPTNKKQNENLTNFNKTNFSTISVNDQIKTLSKEKISNLINLKTPRGDNNEINKQYLHSTISNADNSTHLHTINTFSFTSPKFSNNLNGKTEFINSNNILNSNYTKFFSKNSSKTKITNIGNIIFKTDSTERNQQLYKHKDNYSYSKIYWKKDQINSEKILSQNQLFNKIIPNKNTHKLKKKINFSSNNKTTEFNIGEEKEYLVSNIIRRTLNKAQNKSKKKEHFFESKKKLAENSSKNNFGITNSHNIKTLHGNNFYSINSLIQENLHKKDFNDEKFFINSDNNMIRVGLNKINEKLFTVNGNSNSKSNKKLKNIVQKEDQENNDSKFKLYSKLGLMKDSDIDKNISTNSANFIDKGLNKGTTQDLNKHQMIYNNNSNSNNKKINSPTYIREINYNIYDSTETFKDELYDYSTHKKSLYFKDKNDIIECKGNNKKDFSKLKQNHIYEENNKDFNNYNKSQHNSTYYANSNSTKKFVFDYKNHNKIDNIDKNHIVILNSELKYENNYNDLHFKNFHPLTTTNKKANFLNFHNERRINSYTSFLSSDFQEKNYSNLNSKIEKEFLLNNDSNLVNDSKISKKEDCLITNSKIGINNNNLKINENPFIKNSKDFKNSNAFKILNISKDIKDKNNGSKDSNQKCENKHYKSQLSNNLLNIICHKTQGNQESFNNYEYKIKEKEVCKKNDFEDSLISENNKIFSFKKHINNPNTLDELKKSVNENHNNVVRKIDYYDTSPHTNNNQDQDKNNNNNREELVFTPYLMKHFNDGSSSKNIENKINNTNNNLEKSINENSSYENIGLTDKLKKIGQKYNNLIKDKEHEFPLKFKSPEKIDISLLKHLPINDYNGLLNILSTNIQEVNQIINNDNCPKFKSNFETSYSPSKNINKNLIIKENTIIHTTNTKQTLKDSEPISNFVNYVENKSSFVFSNDIRRNLNFQDSQIFSNNNNLEKIDNIIINKNHNRIFSTDKSRLFSDSLSLNYNETSENNLNNNNIENALDKTEADKFINFINEDYKHLNSKIVNKNILGNKNPTSKEIENANTNLKSSLNNLNEILNYDLDSLIFNSNDKIENIYTKKYKNNVNNSKIYDQNIILESELRDSREYMINHIIDNHIKSKNSMMMINMNKSNNNNFKQESDICNTNEKEYILEKDFKNEITKNGNFSKTESDINVRISNQSSNNNFSKIISVREDCNISNIDIFSSLNENLRSFQFNLKTMKEMRINSNDNNNIEGNIKFSNEEVIINDKLDMTEVEFETAKNKKENSFNNSNHCINLINNEIKGGEAFIKELNNNKNSSKLKEKDHNKHCLMF